MNKPNEIIVVLDFGGQYNQLIARRIRDLGVYSELLPYNTSAQKIKELSRAALFSQEVLPACIPRMHLMWTAIYDLGLPIFGICYGMRLMAQQLDGKVERASKRERAKPNWSLLELDACQRD